MFRLLAGAAVLALAAFTARADDATEFKEYVSKEGKYKTQFPGKATATETKAKDGSSVYTVTSQPKVGQVYTITYLDLPTEIPADQVKKTLPLFAAGIKGKALSEKEVTLGKLPGREAIYDMGNAHIRHFMVLDGKRLYQVIVGGPAKDDVTSKDADKFIKSFEVTK